MVELQQALLKIAELLQQLIKPPVVPDNIRVLGLLAKQVDEFSYDPENGVTFDRWFLRHRGLFQQEGVKLEDAARVRFLLRKLDLPSHSRYLDFIKPKLPSNYDFAETVQLLTLIFGTHTFNSLQLENLKMDNSSLIDRPDSKDTSHGIQKSFFKQQYSTNNAVSNVSSIPDHQWEEENQLKLNIEDFSSSDRLSAPSNSGVDQRNSLDCSSGEQNEPADQFLRFSAKLGRPVINPADGQAFNASGKPIPLIGEFIYDVFTKENHQAGFSLVPPPSVLQAGRLSLPGQARPRQAFTDDGFQLQRRPFNENTVRPTNVTSVLWRLHQHRFQVQEQVKEMPVPAKTVKVPISKDPDKRRALDYLAGEMLVSMI